MRDRNYRRNQYARELQKKQYRQKVVERKFYRDLKNQQILTELEEQEKDYMTGGHDDDLRSESKGFYR